MQLIGTRFFLLVFFTFVFYMFFPKQKRWLVLLVASIVFYLSSGVFSFAFILIFTLSSYLFALLISKRDRLEGEFIAENKKEHKIRKKKKSYTICVFALFVLLSLWMAVRTLSPIAATGVSFYSLRTMSYLIDVQRGRVEAQRSLPRYALFVTFFPLAYLGPVALYRDVGESLYEGRRANADEVTESLLRIMLGVFKKVVIANALSFPLSEIASSPDEYAGAYVLFLLVFYTVEIYCDFSGGIDICIGVAMLFGVELPENFKKPFSSTNLRDFWNRWHITLGEWFETYIFYPISLSSTSQRLSKKSRKRFGTHFGKRLPLYASTLFTWLLTGLWHGGEGHFISWGLINGLLVLISQEIARPVSKFYDRHKIMKESRLRVIIGRVRVFLIIGAVRLLDVYKSLPLTARMLLTVFYRRDSYGSLFGGGLTDVITPSVLCVVVVAITMIFFLGWNAAGCKKIAKKPIAAAACILLLTLSSIVFGTYGLGFDSSDFIYSHFNGG